MPDRVLIHDPLIQSLQESLHFRDGEQFDPWFETNGQKLIGVQQEWVYGAVGLTILELTLPFATAPAAHDFHDAYREWMNNPGDRTRVEVKRQGRRVYSAQHYNETHKSWSSRDSKKHGSWSAHRGLSSLSNVPTLRHYAVEGLKDATWRISSIRSGIYSSLENASDKYPLLPTETDNQLEGFLRAEFDKIESRQTQIRLYPYLLVMQYFEQV
jgi:hypothetical protein